MANKPSSFHTSGPASYFVPTADEVLDDDGNPVPPGPESLEVQRVRLKAAEDFAKNPEAKTVKKDVLPKPVTTTPKKK